MRSKILLILSAALCLFSSLANALVIDFSTFFGGSDDVNFATDVGVDAAGRIYAVGQSNSPDMPITNAFQAVYGGKRDGFVMCYDPATSNLVYATFIGGAEEDFPTAILVNDDGNIFIAGLTRSDNFPITNAFQVIRKGGSEGFIMQLDPNGNLVWSTFFGGGNVDEIIDMARDGDGNLYVVGFTESGSGFPILNAFQPNHGGIMDAFVAKLTGDGATLVYSSFLGGGAHDAGFAIDVGSDGGAVVTGETFSDDFPTVRALQGERQASHSAFVTKVGPTGTNLVYSTYFGRNTVANDALNTGLGVVIDPALNAYVVFDTTSPSLLTTNAFDRVHNGLSDVFILRLSPSGTNVTYASYLGGKSIDLVHDIALTESGRVVVSGATESSDFPIKDFLQPKLGGSSDMFVTIFDASLSNLTASSFIGGKGDDDAFGMSVDGSTIYLAGYSKSSNFPLVNPIPNVPVEVEAAAIVKILPISPHDLTITKLKAPKKVTLQEGKEPKASKITVELVNRSPHTETIASLGTITNLVQVTVESLGGCDAPQLSLNLPTLPINWSSGGKLKLTFMVTFTCANNPAQGVGSEDYRITATVNHAAIDGNADTAPGNDSCPRDPSGADVGCGNKDQSTGDLGADILTDVVVK